MKWTKERQKNLDMWTALFKKDPKLAIAHASWCADQFVVVRDELNHRLFMVQDQLDRIEKMLKVKVNKPRYLRAPRGHA